MELERRFLSAARALSLTGRRVLIAVSGGADSVALTRLLAASADELALTLFAAHMEHGIRGAASEADCAFVEALCAGAGIPLIVRHADVPREARKAGEGLETCARRLRHAFLEEARVQVGADCIALAHHADDQAETVLMHLLRGSGAGGAAGMRPVSGAIVRPLLSFTRAEIEEYLAAAGQPFCTDATNAMCDNPRNALRHQVFPALTAIYPGAVRALGRFAAVTADEDAFAAEKAEEAWNSCAQQYAGIVILRGADALAPCILRRLIRRALPGLDFEATERLRLISGHALEAGGAEGWRLGGDLYLSPPLTAPAPVPVPDEGVCLLPGVCALTVRPAVPVPVRDDPFTQAVRAETLKNACLRTRRPGDFIRPFGLNGQKKSLSDYLTDRKFPLPLRARLPVLARDSEILWAAGVGLSEALRLIGGMEARLLHIEIDR